MRNTCRYVVNKSLDIIIIGIIVKIVLILGIVYSQYSIVISRKVVYLSRIPLTMNTINTVSLQNLTFALKIPLILNVIV